MTYTGQTEKGMAVSIDSWMLHQVVMCQVPINDT